MLVGRRIRSRFRKPGSCHGLNKFSSIFQNKKSPQRGCLSLVDGWKVYVCLCRHFLLMCQRPSGSPGCIGRCKATAFWLLLTELQVRMLFPTPVMYLEQSWTRPKTSMKTEMSRSLIVLWVHSDRPAALKPPASPRPRCLPPVSAGPQTCGTCEYKGAFIGVRVCSWTQDRCVFVTVKHVSSLPWRRLCKRLPVLCDSAVSGNGEKGLRSESFGRRSSVICMTHTIIIRELCHNEISSKISTV